MSGVRILAAAGFALGLLSPCMAMAKDPPTYPYKPIEEKALSSGGAIDPAKGYIALHTQGRFSGSFIRVPDAEDKADYQFLYDKAYDKTVKAYPTKLAGWESDVAIAKQTRTKAPEKPLPPSRENFSIGDIALRTLVGIGPLNAFSKDSSSKETYYLEEVKPGTYIYYVVGLPLGGMCYCMGSVRFEVKAGEITNLGNFLNNAPDYASQRGAQTPAKVVLLGAREVDYTLPASLANLPSSKAQFRAAGKINNIYGITVSRMPPVSGVLAYRRDTVIDVASGQEIPPGLGEPPLSGATMTASVTKGGPG